MSAEKIGGVFCRREFFPLNHELIDGVASEDHMDLAWRWSDAAATAGMAAMGSHYVLQRRTFACMRLLVMADGWWHLCSIVGITEGVARLCYEHPEEGQESAAAKAKPVTRKGPVIVCQGDYFE